MSAFDAAIVGGGIIGGSIAFELARANLRVVLLDRQQPGHEASWAAAGMLTPAPDTADSIPLVPLARASLELYPDFIAAVEEESGHPTSYRREGALEVFFGAEAARALSTLLAVHHGVGLATEPIREEEARQLEPSLSTEVAAAAWLPYEGMVDNRLLTEAVLEAARHAGTEIRAGSEVTGLAVESGRCSGVRVNNEKIAAEHVVIAAGSFSGRLEAAARYAPTRPARGQMAALRSVQVRLGRAVRSARGYVVPREDGRVLVGSTIEDAGFEKAVTLAGMQQILSAGVEILPELAGAAIVETWSGLRPDTPDHLPILGRTDLEGLWIATGHFRNGILLAPITARLLREWILDRRVALPVDEFSPMRFAGRPRSAAQGTR